MLQVNTLQIMTMLTIKLPHKVYNTKIKMGADTAIIIVKIPYPHNQLRVRIVCLDEPLRVGAREPWRGCIMGLNYTDSHGPLHDGHNWGRVY